MMQETINHLAELINSGRDVALYAASPQASQIIYALKTKHGVSPVCIVDGDVFKHHKQLQSLEIMPLKDALQKWPNLHFYCASPLNNSAIIGNLLENNVPKSRIINYEPVEKRLGCPELDNNCTLSGQRVCFCCETEFPLAIENSGDYQSMAKEILFLRDKTILNLKNGEPTPCDHCDKLREGYYFINKKTRIFWAGETGICNFKCKYCSFSHWGYWDFQSEDIDCVSFMKCLSELEETSNMDVSIATGEITIHPNRKLIFALCDNRTSTIVTNASIFDTNVADLLAQGFCALNVSLDAGTRKTFAKIKGADCFDKVLDNLQKYRLAANYSAFVLKYIFIPDINLGRNDLLGFVEICKKLDPINVIISYDAFADKTPNDKTVQSMKTLYTLLDSLGIIVQFSFIPNEVIKIIRGNKNA